MLKLGAMIRCITQKEVQRADELSFRVNLKYWMWIHGVPFFSHIHTDSFAPIYNIDSTFGK